MVVSGGTLLLMNSTRPLSPYGGLVVDTRLLSQKRQPRRRSGSTRDSWVTAGVSDDSYAGTRIWYLRNVIEWSILRRICICCQNFSCVGLCFDGGLLFESQKNKIFLGDCLREEEKILSRALWPLDGGKIFLGST